MKYGLNPFSYDEEMVSYVVDGEFLDNIFGSIPFENLAKKEPLYVDEGSSFDKHGIGIIIKALEDKEYENNKKKN